MKMLNMSSYANFISVFGLSGLDRFVENAVDSAGCNDRFQFFRTITLDTFLNDDNKGKRIVFESTSKERTTSSLR
jgi:hypothetical protein